MRECSWKCYAIYNKDTSDIYIGYQRYRNNFHQILKGIYFSPLPCYKPLGFGLVLQ